VKEVTLDRTYLPDRTIGRLTFPNRNATATVITLERPWLNNQHDTAKGIISCIPECRVLCKKGYMATHKVNHYELQGVKDRTAIFIHRGLFVTDSLGCILLPTGSIKLFEAAMKWEDFMLTITSKSGGH
jgi:hypothetical protein